MNRLRLCLAGLVLAMGAPATPAVAQSSIFEVARVRVGVIASSRARPAMQRMEAFRRLLADRLRVPVELVSVRDAAALADGLSAQRIDMAAMSASAYVATDRACKCLDPLVVARSVDGMTAWRSVAVVRADSTAQTLADLKGGTLALGPDRSFSANVLPLAAMAAAGIDVRSHFSRLETVAGPADALRAVLDRKADAALAWIPFGGTNTGDGPAGPIGLVAAQRKIDPASLRVVWMTDRVPRGPVVVRSALPTTLRTKLRDLLVTLRDDSPEAYEAIEPEQGGGFVAIDALAFQPLATMLSGKPVAKSP